MRLQVVTQVGRHLDADVSGVQIPTQAGYLGVLEGHTPLLIALGVGLLRWEGSEESGVLVVEGGFAEVLPEAVTVLADSVMKPQDMDLDALFEEREDILKELPKADSARCERLLRRLESLEARIGAAKLA